MYGFICNNWKTLRNKVIILIITVIRLFRQYFAEMQEKSWTNAEMCYLAFKIKFLQIWFCFPLPAIYALWIENIWPSYAVV